MQIACPQCATTYDLDPELLPPGGAPVQCTRCSHVFIAQPPGEAPATPGRTGTQVFGTGAPEAPAAPARAATQQFGTALPDLGPAAAPRASTQVFGAPATPPPPGRSGTQQFGVPEAAGAPPAPGEAPRRSTQVFGAPAVPAVPAVEPLAPRSSTQLMGAVTGPAAPPPRSSTQVFGQAAPAGPDAPPPARTATQQFGQLEAPAPAAPAPRASTQVFGQVTPPEGGPLAAGAPPQPAPPTGGPAPASPPRASTQVFGQGAAGGAVPPAVPPVTPRASTHVFGKASPAEPGAPAPRASTQVFGQQVSGPPVGPPGAPADAPRASTQLMGAVEPPSGPAAEAPQAPARGPSQLPEASPGPRATLPFGAAAAAGPGAPAGAPGAPTGGPGRVRLELPPDAPSLLTGHERDVGGGGDAGASPGVSRRTVAVLGALALAALALLLWRQLAPRPYAPPDASQLALGDATRLLRRDDLASREGALKALQALVTDQPQYVQARAEQVVALAFHLDDLRVMLAEDADARRALEAEADALAAAQAPSDWENRVHALRQQGVQLQSRSGPRQARADAVRRELDAAFAALGALRPEQPAPAEEQARVRAEAVRAAVLGSPELPALTERYRLLRANDGWEDVAYAEYVANVTGARGGADEARATLKQMRGQDPTFVRLYILDARLALQARDPASARASLESALSLNPEHTLARLLLERALRDTPPEPQEAEVPEAGDPTPTP